MELLAVMGMQWLYTHQVSSFLLQVDRLEVVNKRFVRVIFVSGKSPHEWVNTFSTYTWDIRNKKKKFFFFFLGKFDVENLVWSINNLLI